jgi:GT2 family glycosyltransferase
MPQIDLSIIIVNWNTKDLLLECLSSLSNQETIFKTEIIVVDNASTDGSAEAVIEHYQHVKVIRNDFNMGFGRAHNIGIKNSLGRYVCLLNSDALVLPNCLKNLIEFMDKNKTIGISGPKTFYPDFSLQHTCRKFPGLWNTFCGTTNLNKIFPQSDMFSDDHMVFFDHNTTRKVDGLSGCCLMIRKNALDQIGLFDEQFFLFFEETDLCKRFRNAGWDIEFFPDASIVHHHYATASKDPVRFDIELIKSQIKYWKKHHNKIAVKTMLFISLIHHSIRLILKSILYIFTALEKRMQTTNQLLKHYYGLKLILSGKDGRER